MSQLEEFEKRVRGAVETLDCIPMGRTRAWGVDYNAVQDRWTFDGKCCCPLEAVLLIEQPFAFGHPTPSQSRVSILADWLGVRSDVLLSFIAGFDGAMNDAHNLEAYELGQKFAREYI